MRMRVLALVVLFVAAFQSTSAQDWEPRRRRSRDGVQIRVGRDYHLPADQIVTWPVVVVAGSATIDGRLDEDLIVLGGPVRIGPTAHVRGEVVAVGGDVTVSDSAEVTGEIHDVGILWPEIRFALRDWFSGVDRGWWAAFAMVGTVLRFTIVLLTAGVLALAAPAWIRRIQDRVVDTPLAAGFVGVGAELFAAPLALVIVAALIVTVIGIPLLMVVPFALLAFIVTWLAGFTAVAGVVGARARLATGLGGFDSPVIDVAWGVLLLFVLTFVGNLFAFGTSFLSSRLATAFNLTGFVVEYLAWTIGLGAALLAPMYGRWRTTPPPVPTTASANA